MSSSLSSIVVDVVNRSVFAVSLENINCFGLSLREVMQDFGISI
jgi:hypothetical protein